MTRKLHPRAYQLRFLSGASVRADGRAPDAARRATLTAGSVGTAVGSAMAKLGRTTGRTTAVAGVSATLVPPSAGEPGAGRLDVVVHPAALGARGGRDRSDGGIAAFLKEALGGIVDLEALCVEEGVLVWALKVSVYCVDNDGNAEDAMLFAAVGALLDVRLPTVRMVDDLPEGDPDAIVYRDEDEDAGEHSDNGDDEEAQAAARAKAAEDERVLAVVSEERTERLQIADFSLSVSFALLDEYVLLDPSRDEETVADGRITLVFRSKGALRSVLKPGGAAVSPALIARCLPIAQRHLADMLKQLNLPVAAPPQT